MVQKIIQQGAEAKIFLNEKENLITKDRISKSYRIPELDNKIRKRRTKAETKLLTKASEVINVPLPKKAVVGDGRAFKITMPFIDGKTLSEHLNNFPLKKQKEICKLIGEEIAKLHNSNIIHGDLTTSNIILKNKKIYFVDFGLGFFNGKYEDKAVDIHLFKQALEAKHFKNWIALFQQFEKGYKNSKDSKTVFERLKTVEKRGRYRH